MIQKSVYFSLAATLLFWASAFVGIRYALVSFSPGAMALLRFLVASLCMAVVFILKSNKTLPNLKDLIQMSLLGFLGIGIYNITLNIGELTVSAGIASFIIGLVPVISVILSYFFFDEKITPKILLSIFISLIGMVLIAIGESEGQVFDMGVLSILIATLMGALYTVFQKTPLKKFHPIEVSSYAIWSGTLFLWLYIPDLLHELPKAKPQATLAVIYMGIFPAAIAYACWSYVVAKMTIAKASSYLYSLPFLSTIMAFFLLSEIPSLTAFVGGLIALIGAMLIYA